VSSPGWHCHAHRKETKKKKPPQYRVMLHNDSFNRREYVVKILLKVVDVITMADAVNIMQVNLNHRARTAAQSECCRLSAMSCGLLPNACVHPRKLRQWTDT
jgi:ATP-dependent Clp protease adaptor protein ClpS